MFSWQVLKFLNCRLDHSIRELYNRSDFLHEIRQHPKAFQLFQLFRQGPITVEDNPGNWTTIDSQYIDGLCRVIQSELNMDVANRLQDALGTICNLTQLQRYQTLRSCIHKEEQLMIRDGECFDKDLLDIFNEFLQLQQNTTKLVTEYDELKGKLRDAASTREFCQFLENGGMVPGASSEGIINLIADQRQKLANLEFDIQHKSDSILSLGSDYAHQAGRVANDLHQLVTSFVQTYRFSSWSEEEDLAVTTDDIERWYIGLLELCTTTTEVGQDVYNSLYQVIWQAEQSCVVGINGPNFSDFPTVRKARELIVGTEDYLRRNSLVVEKQPPTLVGSPAALKLQVRVLGGRARNLEQSVGNMEAVLIHKRLATWLYEGKDGDVFAQVLTSVPRNGGRHHVRGAGELTNFVATEADSRSPEKLVYSFERLEVTNVPRQTRGPGSILEKYCLLFHTQMTTGQERTRVWCCSMPFLVYVHSNQKNALGPAGFWEKYFKQRSRIPFSVPAHVSWSTMAIALNKYIQMMTKNTKRSLTPTNLRFLAQKFCGTTEPNSVSFEDLSGTAEGFRFSKWKWLMGTISMMIEGPLKDAWENGYCIGFIGRSEAEDLLEGKPVGSVIIRFSNSTVDAITISCVYMTSGSRLNVFSMEPFKIRNTQRESQFLRDKLLNLAVNGQPVHARMVCYYEMILQGDASVREELTRKDIEVAFPASAQGSTRGTPELGGALGGPYAETINITNVIIPSSNS